MERPCALHARWPRLPPLDGRHEQGTMAAGAFDQDSEQTIAHDWYRTDRTYEFLG